MSPEETFLSRCVGGELVAEEWRGWLEKAKRLEPDAADAALLGLDEAEFQDLGAGIRTMDFYALKRRDYPDGGMRRIWGGCYARYLFESDPHNPEYQAGWVDLVDNEHGFARIQCDDEFDGARAVTVRVGDIVEILPNKERPLVYYKTMACGECNKCDHSSNAPVPEGCHLKVFFDAVLAHQGIDRDFQQYYTTGVLRSDAEEAAKRERASSAPENHGEGCGGCHACGGH